MTERMAYAPDGELEVCGSCAMDLTWLELTENDGLCEKCYREEMMDRELTLKHPDNVRA